MADQADDDRLKALDARIAAAKAAVHGPRRETTDGHKQAQLAWRMVIELVAGLGIGFGIGYGLDTLFGTLPIFLVLFIFAGLAAGVKTMLRSAREARQALESFGLPVLAAEVPLLAAFDKAEARGVTVDLATDDRGRADPRRMAGWAAYQTVAQEIECLISKPLSVVSRIITPLPLSA